jgi:phosphatidylinositol alpha 1,6-mannosyltransferase
VTVYVAMGDSFTAGLDPDEPRWPDVLARELGPNVRYENLAVVGATSVDVEREQLTRAIELEPDLITLVCGANDVLESTRPDAGEYARRLAGMFRRLRREAPDAEIMSATYPDISRFLDLRPRSRARVEKGMEVFNAAARKVALSHGVVLLEGFDHPAAQERSTFGEDGFHPSEEGHMRAAREFMRALRERMGGRPWRRGAREVRAPKEVPSG